MRELLQQLVVFLHRVGVGVIEVGVGKAQRIERGLKRKHADLGQIRQLAVVDAQVEHAGGRRAHDAQVRQLDVGLEEARFGKQPCGVLLEGRRKVGSFRLARADVAHKELELGDGVHHAYDAAAERCHVERAGRVLAQIPLVEVGHAGGDVNLAGFACA